MKQAAANDASVRASLTRRVEVVLQLRGRACVALGMMLPPEPDVGILRPWPAGMWAVDPDGEVLALSGEERGLVYLALVGAYDEEEESDG